MAACRWNCGKLSEIAQLRSMYRRSRPRQWAYSRCVTISMLGHSNGAARHATTHKRPRCLHPGSRSGHGGERTGFQFKPSLTTDRGRSTAARSCPGCAQSPARSQYFERPNTWAVAGTFAVDERQRTGDAARSYDAAAGAAVAHAPFRRPTGPSPFRFPIPDGSLA
jgi:hypothetical protein